MNNEIREPPQTLLATLKELGPGLIIAGSIVGSGELIATTLTGAEAGFWLLWIILLGCVVKVFAQLEIGRYTISTGHTTLAGLSRLPGPRLAKVHWIVWLWLIMFITTLGQYGGIVGAVGQAITISAPLTAESKQFNQATHEKIKQQIASVLPTEDVDASSPKNGERRPQVASPDVSSDSSSNSGNDPYYWALLVTIVTSSLLYFGKYRLIEKLVMILVGGFTAMSIINFCLLQQTQAWAVRIDDIQQGLSFRLPPARPGVYPVATALATFGIIGIAAGELLYYPYWCLEKGYARFVGPRDASPQWNARAKGWIRVMHWDAWCSMIVYTISTVTFYLLGAAVLSRADIRPQGLDLIRTLSAMYEPVFGSLAVSLFLVGSIAVLYSTFLVGSASNVLVFADSLDLITRNSQRRLPSQRTRPLLGFALPVIAFVMFVFLPNPKILILISGMTQTFMLPILAFAALYFRYRLTSPELRPNRLWDTVLWISAFTLLLVGLWLASRLLGLST